MAAVQRLCTKGVFLQGGQLKESGSISKILDSYQRSLDLAASTTGSSEILRDGEVRFLSWELANGEQKHTCFTRDTCEFLINFKSKAELTDGKVSFILWDMNGNLVLAANTAYNNMPYFRLSEGLYQIRAKVRLPIKAGMYQVEMILGSLSRGWVERSFVEPKLHVLPREASMPEQWHGYVTEPVEFKLDWPNAFAKEA